MVEQFASIIFGELSDKKYVPHRTIGGTMPRLNRVFEETKVTYGDPMVPDKVLKSVQEKAAKAAKSTVSPAGTAKAVSRKSPEGCCEKRGSQQGPLRTLLLRRWRRASTKALLRRR